jgi:hypothetical protein
MHNANMSGAPLNSYKWTKDGVPTRETCDLDDPKEMFLWCYAGLPGINGAPLLFPNEVFAMWSEHMYECGARLVADAIKKYRPPNGREPNWATAPGRWVDSAEPDPPQRPALAAWQGLQWMQQTELVQAILGDDEFWERLPTVLKARLQELVGGGADDAT